MYKGILQERIVCIGMEETSSAYVCCSAKFSGFYETDGSSILLIILSFDNTVRKT